MSDSFLEAQVREYRGEVTRYTTENERLTVENQRLLRELRKKKERIKLLERRTREQGDVLSQVRVAVNAPVPLVYEQWGAGFRSAMGKVRAVLEPADGKR